MRYHDDEFTYGADADAGVAGAGSAPDRRGRSRAARRAAGGHRRNRRRTPLMAAAAVVLLAGVGSAYALISDEAPERTAATGSPSALAGRPDEVDGLPATTASAAAGAGPSATQGTAGPSAVASAPASASASAPGPGPQAKDGEQRSGAPATERAAKPAAPPTGGTPASGPAGPDPKVPGPRTSTQDVATAQSLSLQLLNNERAAVGRPPLALKQDLSDFARKWAEHMKNNGFAHSSSADRAYLKTGSRTWTGENIVWYSDASMTAQEAAEKFQSMWRHSSGHYKAQVNPDFTEVGVGLYHDSTGWWGVHNFSDGK
ncbi:CAP domain-containing protein [Streptomyces xanthophaeus]|uniref:CAP domain-containing protein n=1 Tax=Streptomyces xanthophaeus TaxID=67385 RepID=UPI002648EFD5|nr:CAP domain-containing protein [Streptomyces xanthophaeus]WKD33538.1 CAP domain-containing protein [Streptomyces xanthophaeus]